MPASTQPAAKTSNRRQDIQLFQAVMTGDHQARGFYNADIRKALWKQPPDRKQQLRQTHAVSRLLKRLQLRR